MTRKLGFYAAPTAFTLMWLVLSGSMIVVGYSPMLILIVGTTASYVMFLIADIYRRFWRLATENRALREKVLVQAAQLAAATT